MLKPKARDDFLYVRSQSKEYHRKRGGSIGEGWRIHDVKSKAINDSYLVLHHAFCGINVQLS